MDEGGGGVTAPLRISAITDFFTFSKNSFTPYGRTNVIWI